MSVWLLIIPAECRHLGISSWISPEISTQLIEGLRLSADYVDTAATRLNCEESQAKVGKDLNDWKEFVSPA